MFLRGWTNVSFLQFVFVYLTVFSLADETFHVSYAYLYSMVGWRDIDRTYKCVSEWRFFLVKSCIYPFILSCFWQPYECVTGLSKVFWVVVSRYVCYSVCFSIGKNSKVKFLIFFSWVVSFVLGSLWVVLRSSSVVWRSLWIVVGRCGIVVGRCGSLWVVPGFSNYEQSTWSEFNLSSDWLPEKN